MLSFPNKPFILSSSVLNVIMLSVIMVSVCESFMLSVIYAKCST
jgi:hypothetical protein